MPTKPGSPSIAEQQPTKEMEWAEFLSMQPPYSECKVTGSLAGALPDDIEANWDDAPNRITLFCDSMECGGNRIFLLRNHVTISPHDTESPYYFLLKYSCKHCDQREKVFALSVVPPMDVHSNFLVVMKLGELPAFGPITPPRLLRLVQSDRELYLKGRRSESQGLGIGAFAYYRRVVENQKDQLIDGIIKVSKRLKVAEPIIANLESAKQQIQFSSAIEMIRDGIPDSLKIEGKNPLSLLHSALSKGIHSESEDECLELAASIRLVLTNLAENIDQALQDHAELSEAVKRLSQSGSRQKEKTDPSKPRSAGSGADEPT
jgi:hypothetical protein